ncbi:hypothetical protein HELRODRAFT_191184 [Helobdella robusta]|uniref:Uncharacterized protein n=1 Tax=Helobdella robusta TaxID=6412 RepID=T1FSQ0_HELRO|nr:hypothetical protein HELRODRAFT_191184 [Helobdella robusta]ESO06760.1 hypothetical protein HELRODRAFT_191184 [Helobdella robusta]
MYKRYTHNQHIHTFLYKHFVCTDVYRHKTLMLSTSVFWGQFQHRYTDGVKNERIYHNDEDDDRDDESRENIPEVGSDKDIETFDMQWDYHSDLAAVNSPAFISNRPLVDSKDSKTNDSSSFERTPPPRTRKESLVLFYLDDDFNDGFIADEDEFFIAPSLIDRKDVGSKYYNMHVSYPSGHSTPRKLNKKKALAASSANKSTALMASKHLNASLQLESDFKKCIARLLHPSSADSKASATSTKNSPRRLKNLQNFKNTEKFNNHNECNKNNVEKNNTNNSNKIFGDDAPRVLGEVRKLFEHLEVDLNINLTQLSSIRKAYSKIFEICGAIEVRAFHSYTYSILAPITYQLLINNCLNLDNIGGTFQNVVQHLVAAVDNMHSYLMNWKYKGSTRVPKNEVLFKLINSLKISCEQMTAISSMTSLKCRQQYVTSLMNHGVDMECHLVEAMKIIICLNAINFFKTHTTSNSNDTKDINSNDDVIFSDVLNNNYNNNNTSIENHKSNNNNNTRDKYNAILMNIVRKNAQFNSAEEIFNMMNCIDHDECPIDDIGLSVICCLLNADLRVIRPHKYSNNNQDDDNDAADCDDNEAFLCFYPNHVLMMSNITPPSSSPSSSPSSPKSPSKVITIIEDKPGQLYCLPVDSEE